MNWFGFRCVYCQRKLAIAKHGLCCRCNKQIKRFIYCGRCGKELVQHARYCGYCLQHKISWDGIVFIGRYVDPLSSLIHRFKFQKGFFLDRTLARLLLLAILDAKRTHGFTLPEVIVPVPLHRIRQWQRGYNQADLLAQCLSKWLRLPCDNTLLLRVKHTHTQRGLTATARQKNVSNAFKLHTKWNTYPYKSIAIIDDVITTGATLNEMIQELRKIGIEHIQVWGLAKT